MPKTQHLFFGLLQNMYTPYTFFIAGTSSLCLFGLGVTVCASHSIQLHSPETFNLFLGIVLYIEAATGIATIDNFADVTDVAVAAAVYNVAAVSDVVITDVASEVSPT